jgi:hypothetical protein
MTILLNVKAVVFVEKDFFSRDDGSLVCGRHLSMSKSRRNKATATAKK